MDWSPQQQDALNRVRLWLARGDQQVFRLFGYAGTGKTTLARHLAQGVRGDVIFAAFTGKAASVLTRKGAPAQTIHSLIYLPRDKGTLALSTAKAAYTRALRVLKDAPAGERAALEARARRLAAEVQKAEERARQPAFDLNPDSDLRHARLLVLDEVSMVGERIARDLLSFGTRILCLGDPAQLPPVADAGWFTNAEPDVMLTEIHRQAAESPVIGLATQVRRGDGLPPHSPLGNGTQVVPKGVTPLAGLVEQHDIILCGRNRTRRLINRRIRREILGRKDDLPEAGDRVVCLRNNHDIGLLNGQLFTVRGRSGVGPDTLTVELEPDDARGTTLTVPAHRSIFEGAQPDARSWRKANAFDYGWALTVHKSQGSQWPSVFLVDEAAAFRQHARKWLYTGITRAEERVTVATGRASA